MEISRQLHAWPLYPQENKL